jgi:hypothetical protein
MINLLFNFTRSEDATVIVYVNLEVSSFVIYNDMLWVCVVNYAVCFHSRTSGCVEYTFILPWAQWYQSLDENLKYLYLINFYKIHISHSLTQINLFLYCFQMSLLCNEICPSYTVSSESCCSLRLRYVDLVVIIKAAVEVCCCLTVFRC